jgi:5-methylcytosine-specific restriction protein A
VKLPAKHASGAAQQYDRQRRSSNGRKLYNSRYWRDGVRPRILRRDPFCKSGEMCDPDHVGQRAPSTEVDHIVALDHGGDESDDNLQGLCKSCHTAKTRREREGQGVGGHFSRDRAPGNRWPGDDEDPGNCGVAKLRGRKPKAETLV